MKYLRSVLFLISAFGFAANAFATTIDCDLSGHGRVLITLSPKGTPRNGPQGQGTVKLFDVDGDDAVYEVGYRFEGCPYMTDCPGGSNYLRWKIWPLQASDGAPFKKIVASFSEHNPALDGDIEVRMRSGDTYTEGWKCRLGGDVDRWLRLAGSSEVVDD